MKTHDSYRFILSAFAIGLAIIFILPGAVFKYKFEQFKNAFVSKG